ncbi:head-tail connector protein [Sphingopyxis fribergensis]
MTTSLLPGEVPVSLNEARGWLRLGPSVDDAIVAQLLRAATSICEAYIGQWLIVRAAEEILTLYGGAVRLTARPVVAVETVTLLPAGGGETMLDADGYRLARERGGAVRLTLACPDGARVRISYRAGMAEGVNGIPEAIRQGIVRMTQHLHDARGGANETPPAVIAALWQPWRLLGLGGGR